MSKSNETLCNLVGHILQNHPEVLEELLEPILIASSWGGKGFASPAPNAVKRAVLIRNSIPGATWIETGTLFGDTTKILAQVASTVYTIEPDSYLYEQAKDRLSSNKNVHVINELSEIALPKLLATISGDLCFWLDGHYSGTGTHAGPLDTPIEAELNDIESNLGRFSRVMIAIDDIRLFTGKLHAYGNYPTLDSLVAWAQKNGLRWVVEHDIFIAKNE